MSNTIQFNKDGLANAIECLPNARSPNEAQAGLNAKLIASALAGALSNSEPAIAEKICAAIGISTYSPAQVQA